MQDSIPKSRSVSLQERAFTMGEFIGINGYRINHTVLKNYFAKIGYSTHETPHFLIGQHSKLSKKLVIHRFAPDEIDATLGSYLLDELKPLGILSQPQQFSDLFGVILFSLFPHDIQKAQHLFAMNTFKRYHKLLEDENILIHSHSTVEMFATLYRRVFELLVGESVLDAGCSFGFMPLLLGERFPSLKKIVGIDIEAEPFLTVRAIAKEYSLNNVSFKQVDLLSDNFETLGCFDTVILLHVLEHFTEQQMYQVLTHILKLVSQRLIIAVPYEAVEPEVIYDHKQLFSEKKLEIVGQWCIEQLKTGQTHYEYCEGGLLIISR